MANTTLTFDLSELCGNITEVEISCDGAVITHCGHNIDISRDEIEVIAKALQECQETEKNIMNFIRG